MGQRHQVFAIAKLIPKGDTKAYYRCIAAWHHQWCYGTLPLKAARRFLTLLQQKDNAEIVLDEICRVQNKFGRWRKKPELPNLPCSYISFLMGSAWNADMDDPADPYFHRGTFLGSILDADMGSTRGDNNDGITVIDVSNPLKPAYCFVSVNGLESAEEVPDMEPLSAEQYVRAYYPKEDGPKDASVQNVIDALADESLITLQMLAEAWPGEYIVDFESKDVDESSHDTSVASDPFPSLVDLTLGTALEQGISAEDTSDLENLVWQPAKAVLIKATLQKQNPFPDAGVSLLTQVVLQNPKSVDLSGFSLTTDQLVSVLSAAKKDINTLKLSRNSNVTIETVKAVLTDCPALTRLVLLDTSVKAVDLQTLFKSDPQMFSHLHDLIHPYLLTATKRATYANAFSFISVPGLGGGIPIASLPFLNPAKVVQGLTDALIVYAEMDRPSFAGPDQCSLFPQVAFGSALRTETQRWSERHVSSFPQVSFDAFQGEGWCFTLQNDPMHWLRGRGLNFYGFLKFDVPAICAEVERQKKAKDGASDTNAAGDEGKEIGPLGIIYDLDEFLAAMEAEGRPLPTEAAVNKLRDIMEAMKSKQDIRLMKQSDIIPFIQTIYEGAQFSD
ncbi:uncharacterized protein BT62DRAFT_929226 [Guyanagaster necrorhizus]|uniref:Uncharacterized protein n=1 Tax=Guyanagaster necrorhizus TaxID=856835 RepID=A0A9P7VXB0_9AGAR|nr:uncharacterized protein BT62DRAFT_929226 [Guyanagaster necrorhizus MCA 3950]KAG7449251.1 hypothetical protein BT62DRAFT_929226 [Guyanagaster necrorhizus MCA 3950]